MDASSLKHRPHLNPTPTMRAEWSPQRRHIIGLTKFDLSPVKPSRVYCTPTASHQPLMSPRGMLGHPAPPRKRPLSPRTHRTIIQQYEDLPNRRPPQQWTPKHPAPMLPRNTNSSRILGCPSPP